MRVVVVGATGNIGTSLVGALAGDEGVTEIVGVARREPGPWWAPAKTTFRAADMAEDDLRPIVDGADAVVHLAWLFQPTHEPTVTWHTNVVGSARVFDAVAAAGVPSLVYVSSIGAYSPPPPDDARVDEAWPTHSTPTAGYGREKAYVERILDAFERAHPDVRTVRVRPAFVFKRRAATSQRRIFAGPFVPGSLFRPGRIPVLPHPPGLRFQAVHSHDLGEALRRLVTSDARGPFNVAAEPVLDADRVAGLLHARPVEVPTAVLRGVVAATWRAHLQPAEPNLFELFLRLPVMATRRIEEQTGWTPQHSATDALQEFFAGAAEGAGGPTPPLAGDTVSGRLHEVETGIGERP